MSSMNGITRILCESKRVYEEIHNKILVIVFINCLINKIAETVVRCNNEH